MVKNPPFQPPEGAYTLLNLGVGPPLEPESELFQTFQGVDVFGKCANKFCRDLYKYVLTISQRLFCERFVEDLFQRFYRNVDDKLIDDSIDSQGLFVEDFVEDFVQDLIGDRSTTHRLLCERFVEDTFVKKYLRDQRIKKFTRCVDEKNIHTLCEISAKADQQLLETHASVDTQPIANRCVRFEIRQLNSFSMFF